MYIKKPVLILCAILLIALTVFLTLGVVNPFGFRNLDDFFHFSYVARILEQGYYEELDREELFRGALSGMTDAIGDPYTGYFWGNDAKEHWEDVTGTYQGVGFYLKNCIEDDTIEIIGVIAGTPAEEAGLAVGDKILRANGEEYTGQQIDKMVSLIRSETAEEITLTILQKSSGVTKDVVLIPREIEISCVTGEMLTKTVGRINITQFNVGSAEQFKEQYQKLKKQGMESLVIDLRNNPGGIIDEAVEIADVFLEDGKMIVYTEDRYGNRKEYRAKDDAEKLSIVLLINQYSASGSEVLVGALKDHGISYQIGENSYGKGIVQGVFQMGEAEVLSMTLERCFTPKGVCVHEKGIAPDLEVAMPIEKYRLLPKLPKAEDTQLQAALEYLGR